MYFYEVALSLVPNIGPVLARVLIQHTGSAEAVFRAKPGALTKIPGIGSKTISMLQKNKDLFAEAEKQLAYAAHNKIELIPITDPVYPRRLKACADAPILLYFKGNSFPVNRRVISVVGTRHATDYGREICTRLIESLAAYDPLIISGLAYGVDIWAHRAALSKGLQTVAILGHGLDRIYPAIHKSTAFKMVEQGGLITEYGIGTKPDRENFPARNRIIAGMADAVVVIEARASGGALITAELANSYNRDVFTFPGSILMPASAGCHALIRQNMAQLVTCADDLVEALGWNTQGLTNMVQRKLLVDLTSDEHQVLRIITEEGKVGIDQLIYRSGMSSTKLAAVLLGLQMNGLLNNLPGNIYSVV